MSNEAHEQFFEDMASQHLALTYDDVRLETRHAHNTPPPDELNVTSHFSRNVPLRMPFVSAAMDTVTTSKMAIAMAEFGGIGVIHSAMEPEDQKREVRRVKLHMNGRIDNPVTVRSHQTLREVLNRCEAKDYDFRTFPVIDNDGKFVGLLTGNDFDFCPDKETSVEKAMTPAHEVLSRVGKVSIQSAYDLMTSHKKKTLPILDKHGGVKRLFLHSDVNRIINESEPFNVDANGRLLVAAAVPTDDEGLERVREMRKYVDAVVLDSANGDSYFIFKYLEAIKSEFPDIDVVAGNISTGASARELAIAGADGIKVGQGPGSICTTRGETGIGKPQLSAIYECARAATEFGVPVCADGGIKDNGDISLALAVGASSVMMGNRLAGTKETPGDIITRSDGSRVKPYRGMGSASALQDSKASRKRYGAEGSGPRLPEGVEGLVPYKGNVAEVLTLCWLGLRNSMRYVKTNDLQMHREETVLFRITNSGLRESHPHDVAVVRSS